jgi:hypothetical protein
MPLFPVALVWSQLERADAALQLLTAMEARRKAMRIEGIECLLRPNGAVVFLRLDLPRYPKDELEPLRRQIQEAGGAFLEPVLLPEAEWGAAVAALLEGESRLCVDFKQAVLVLREHFGSLRSRARPAAPPAPVAAPPALSTATFASPAHRQGLEDRRFKRHNVILAVEVKTDGAFTREFALNISKGGIYLTSSQSPQTNTFATLSIRLPDGTVANTRARVVHVREVPGGFGIGLDYQCEMDPQFRQALDRYLATRETESPAP